MKKLIIILLLGFSGFTVFARTKIFTGNDTSRFNVHAKDLSTFIIAIQSTDLAAIYNSNEPLTIFIPDNRAFEKLPAAALDSLLKPGNKTALTTLLSNHIIKGNFTSKDLVRQIHLNNGQAIFTTLAGAKLIASIDANRNIVLTNDKGDKSIIKVFNIRQGNKMLFIVNSVILFP